MYDRKPELLSIIKLFGKKIKIVLNAVGIRIVIVKLLYYKLKVVFAGTLEYCHILLPTYFIIFIRFLRGYKIARALPGI